MKMKTKTKTKTKRRTDKRPKHRGGKHTRSHGQMMRSSSLNDLPGKRVKSHLTKPAIKPVINNKKTRSYIKPLSIFSAKELFRLNAESGKTDIFYEMPKLAARKGGSRTSSRSSSRSKSSTLPFAMDPEDYDTPPVETVAPPTAPPMMDSCRPLTAKELPGLESLMSTDQKCLITVHKDSCSFTRTGPISVSFGKGGFNAVFNNDNFDECVGDQYIMRVSIRPIILSTTSGARYYSNFLEETRLGIIAAEQGIGPNIYKIGLMSDINNANNTYFYSIIDRIAGYDASEMIKTGKFKATAPTSFTISDVITDYYAIEDPDSAEYQANLSMNVIDYVLDLTIKKLISAGERCGFLMMDNKPPNTMVIPAIDDKSVVYLIDYDPQFMLISNDSMQRNLYARTNVVLFLCNALIYSKNDNDTATDTKNSTAVRALVLEKLKREYYDLNVDGIFGFEDVRAFIQKLYFANPAFMHIAHNYTYAESELLKIHYFALYKNVMIDDILARMEYVQANYEVDAPLFMFQTKNSMDLPLVVVKYVADGNVKYMVSRYTGNATEGVNGQKNTFPISFFALKQLYLNKKNLSHEERINIGSALIQCKHIMNANHNNINEKLGQVYYNIAKYVARVTPIPP